ncbi:MAG TPA: Holliday junction branch migration protein RuvA, partial [Magnetococcales bacterium]|nr:Holliday junction branch migration protein RuvA [Magnetococcales bacterium]
MIALLQGTVVEKSPDESIIDVGGVGYRVFTSLLTLEKIPDIGKTCRLLIHTQVREDAFHLYGFSSTEEKNLFKYLNNVNGIGPKLALAVLSSMTPQALIAAIISENVPTLVGIPGIGKKMAQRIVMELRDRLAALPPAQASENAHPSAPPKDTFTPTTRQALLSALLNLGYKRGEAERAIQTL